MKLSSTALLLAWLALLTGCRDAGDVDGQLTDDTLTVRVREVTDGQRLVKAVYDAADNMVDCEASEGNAGANSATDTVDETALKDLHARCLQLHQTAPRSRRSLLVYPGTKWCGKGASAQSYDDLGDSRDTDMCCRAHDFCPFTISGLTSKYNLFNYRFHTLSHCDCDDRLRTCLDSVKVDAIAPIVRSLYFSISGNDCFILKPEKVCVKRSWWGKCQKYMKTYRAVYRQ